MSRSASTAARTEEIILNLTSPNIQAEVYLEVDVDGSWVQIDDIDFERGIDWSESGKREKYNNFALIPLPGTISFSVVNTNGKYFPGSGDDLEGVFDLDTKIRINAGYILDSGSESTETVNLNDTSGIYTKSFFYRTEHSGGTVVLDPDGTDSATHFEDWFDYFYDDDYYDLGHYTPDAYTVQTYDSDVAGLEQFNSIAVTANNTSGTIYYRTFDDPEILDTSQSGEWTSAGALENGTKTVDFTDIENERFIQIAVVYDGIKWSDSLAITAITVNIESRFEKLFTSVYYLDQPKFTDPKAPAMPIINCTGRDIFKKAIGVDIKYEDVNATDIDDIIKSICDKVGILYTATSIADLGGFDARETLTAGNTTVVKSDKLLDQCMQIINTTGYVMYTEYDSDTDDNVLYVQTRPELTDTVGAFNYKNYESIGNISKNYNKVLQRLTVITNSQPTDDEETLATDAFTTTGAKTLTWVGDAEFKRLIVDEPDNITISDLTVTATGVGFTILTISGEVNVTVYGSKWTGDAPVYEGEAMQWDNMAQLNGSTAVLTNPLVISDAEAKSIADSYITQFGTPVYEASGLKWPYMNLIPELNDGYMLWRRFIGGTDSDDIFIVTKINHHFDKNRSPNHYTQFNLEDSGNDYSELGDFVYDTIVDWDKGFVWDMGISTPLSTDAEIDAATTIVHNTDME